MNIRLYITKLQSLPEKQKKIILWAVVVILLAIMGFFWVRATAERLSKMGEDIKTIQLPVIEIPSDK